MSFKGLYRHIIDNKNRFFLPAKMRGGKRTMVMASGFDECLYIYPVEVWEKIIAGFDNFPLNNKSEERAFKRVFLASAKDVDVDSLGRILVPQDLKDEAKIAKNVVIVGVGERLELWSEKIWDDYYGKAKKIRKKLENKLEI